jgi:predicted NBD/HSP70 family sugar kinase
LKVKNSILPMPKVVPPLDSEFRPAVLANRAFRELVQAAPNSPSVQIALEQADGSVFHFATSVLPSNHAEAEVNFRHLERLVKFLLWSWGGFRIHFVGPQDLGVRLQKHFQETPTGKFDARIMGERIYERAFEVIITDALPGASANTTPLGRHLKGCRIGFDLGASDRKVAAVIDGEVVFSEETVWHPVVQTDPQWHFDEIMDSLQRAAKHLPRVDAIGGSSAGVFVNNRVKVASLFRGVPEELFQKRVKNLFLELKAAWGDIPFEIVNDGEVTALAGSMSLGKNAVLGIALGSSQAAGFVTPEGNITSWLNELAFAPVDYNPAAPVDEWSGDRGCGVQYFSQQCVGRLMPHAGIEAPAEMPLPEKLKQVQRLMEHGDPRAKKIYQTIGVYLGYAVAHYVEFYNLRHVLVLGRVTSGPGGEIIVQCAEDVLKAEFPALAQTVSFHIPDEKDKRHGQAIAAASLPRRVEPV